MSRNESKSENAGEKNAHQCKDIALLSAFPVSGVSKLSPCTIWACVWRKWWWGGKEETRKRKKRPRIKDPRAVSNELTQAKVPNLAVKVHLKKLCAPSLLLSLSSLLVLLAVCQHLHRADHFNSDPAHTFKVVHRPDAARKPVTRRETKGIQRMERHSEFH